MLEHRLFLSVLAAFALNSSLSGCVWMRNVCGVPAPPPSCALAPDAAKEDVLAHLNENTRKIRSWKTDRAKIRTRGVLVPLDAKIAVESPRNFRLIVTAPTGTREADLGSNQDHFWFWNHQNQEKYVFQARHDEPAKLKRFPIPFQPDWIIESLGVIDIDPDDVTMQPGPSGSNSVYLIADRVSPQGFKIRKITIVDTCRGVIREHRLQDLHGRTIARAVLSGYPDKPASADLPTKIDLDWPQAELTMTMTLSDIEVNPPRLPPDLWLVPHIAGYAVYDLTE